MNQLSWRAQGTAATVTPCSGQLTRGASATSSQVAKHTSTWRHRRSPPPLSNHTDSDPALAAATLDADLGADPDVETVPTSLASLDELAPHDHHARDA